MRQPYPNELYHYGILGMKWGVRRYQNPDGTLTESGKKRYAKRVAKMVTAREKIIRAHDFEKFSKINSIAPSISADSTIQEAYAANREAFKQLSAKEKELRKDQGRMLNEFRQSREYKEIYDWIDKHDPQSMEEETIIDRWLMLNKPDLAKAYNQNIKEQLELSSEWYRIARDIANNIVGQYGDMPIPNTRRDVKTAVANAIIDNAIDDVYHKQSNSS